MDFTTLTGPQLLAAWNEMVLTAVDLGLPGIKTVKKFADQKTGINRCQKLHLLIQAKNPGAAAALTTDIPEFLDRSKNGIKPAPMPVGPVRSEQPLATTNKTVRPFRIPKGMSDEEGAALIAREAEEKKVKAAARIQDMLEKKKERDAAKLATVNAARAKDGLAALTSLTEKSKTSKQESVMRKAKKVTKTAKAKTTNGSGNGKWTSADATITRLGKGDDYEPKKGTIAAKSWEACKAGTFGKFKEKGGNPAYLRWFANHGYVKVTG